MNKRERMLAYATAGLVALTVLFYTGKRIVKVYTTRAEQITALSEAINEKEVREQHGRRSLTQLAVYQERSLPLDYDQAGSMYRKWMHQWSQDVGMHVERIGRVSSHHYAGAYDMHTFSLSCEGDLWQLTQLLHAFHSGDHLHRVRSGSLKPTREKRLTVNLQIEALSLPGVAPDKSLPEKPGLRLAHTDVQEYFDPFVRRNYFGPANKPPKFSGGETQRGYFGQPVSFPLQASDPEQGKLVYRLGQDCSVESAKIDPETGTVSLGSLELGDYDIPVEVQDDGMPAKTDSMTVRLTVTKQPEVPTGPVVSEPQFNVANYTFITGMIEKNGQPEVWLTNRTEGKLMKLRVGAKFRVGQFEGEIRRINVSARRVEIINGDTLVVLRTGQNLGEATPVTQTSQADAGG